MPLQARLIWVLVSGGGTLENGYNEPTFDIKVRFWYVALEKKF